LSRPGSLEVHVSERAAAERGTEALIDRLIDQVLEEYPVDRVARIKERTNAVWYSQPLGKRIVYIASQADPAAGLPPIPAGATEDQRDLIVQLQTIVNHSPWDDDFFPAIASGLRQVCIPSYFGCVEEEASASNRVGPIVRTASDVYSLPELGFVPGTVGGDILVKMRYFHRRVSGRIPVYMTDMQGPFSVAAQIWGVVPFMLALRDSPDAAHYLLQKCTDVICSYYRLMREAVEGNWVPMHCHPLLWLPEEKGVAISDDFLAIVSPRTTREFSRPYLEQIAAAFGGVTVHSCGSINHAVRELNQVEGLAGLNFSSTETDLQRLAAEVDPRIVLVVHCTDVHRADLLQLTALQHIELCRRIFAEGRVRGICTAFPCGVDPDPARDAEAWRAAATIA
jgi:hypothetical protein